MFNGKTNSPLGGGGYAHILPELSKMMPFTREAIMTAVIEAGARKT